MSQRSKAILSKRKQIDRRHKKGTKLDVQKPGGDSHVYRRDHNKGGNRPQSQFSTDIVLNSMSFTTIQTSAPISDNYAKSGLSPSDIKLIKQTKIRQMEEMPTLTIQDMSMGLYTKEKMIEDSVVKITNTNETGPNSLNDPIMGSIDRDTICGTCSEVGCSGHMGYISLHYPIYNPFFTKVLADILTCICPNPGCGRLLVSKDEVIAENAHIYSGKAKIKILAEMCSSKTISCKNPLQCKLRPRVYSGNEQSNTISYKEQRAKKSTPIRSREVLEILYTFVQNDPDGVEILGIDHPESLVLELLPVIPPSIRPDATFQGDVRKNDLTRAYAAIININNNIKSREEKLKDLKDDHITLTRKQDITKSNKTIKAEEIKLDSAIITLKKWIRSIFHSSDGDMVSLTEYIKGKEGTIRHDMMGKRSNFTARSVANPDSSLDFGEVLVPRVMAKILTYPEKVAFFNMNYLQGLFDSGKINKIQPINSPSKDQIWDVTDVMRQNYKLNIGDIVHRWLQDGDYVILNRQPTLHRFGMIGQKVKLTDDEEVKVIGMHLSVTAGLNADFDGDEVNLHVPQTIEQVAEIINMLNSRACIMNESTNKPIAGLIFDNLLALTLLTEPGILVRPDEFYDLVFQAYPDDSSFNLTQHERKMELYNIPLFSGASVFSSLLPNDFNYRRGAINSENVMIIKGALVHGTLTKQDVGNSGRSIIQSLFQNYGNESAANFIDRASRLLNRYIMYYPVSLGYEACIPDNQDIHDNIRKAEITKLSKDIIAMGGVISDPIEEQRRERGIVSRIQASQNKLDKQTFDNLDPNNPFLLAINSGAKGSKFNLTQVMAMLGQQFFYGDRFKNRLAYTRNDDLDPEAQGFIPRSFLEGLTPRQMFMHQASSRIGVLDTATKTQKTGAMQRIFVKNMENLIVKPNGTVTNTGGQIIQFMYGEDGFDASQIVTQQTTSGTYSMFLDLSNVVDTLNSKHGYVV